ncbi:MAG: DUF4160 domain-containing protein [Candidatus Gracilibacteria bacterium]|nr:DUF4160 domain-containing protein [Candidatus Gracilibacteria bacterium]
MIRKIMMIEDLVEFNNYSVNLEAILKILKDFLEDESLEAFLKEEKAFGIERDFIKSNKHFIDKIDSIKIEIRSDEHPPAHFHVILAEYEGSYDILNCNKMNGNIPRKYEKKIVLWHKYGGKEKLIEKWNLTRPENCNVGNI